MTGRRYQISDDELRRIAARVAAGETVTACTAGIGISSGALTDRLKRAGLYTSTPRVPRAQSQGVAPCSPIAIPVLPDDRDLTARLMGDPSPSQRAARLFLPEARD